MKRRLILVAVLAGLVLPSIASAAVPCRNRVYNDWYHDGRIGSTYPVACYRDALRHMRADAAIYSSLSTDIRAAMFAAINRQHGKTVPAQVGRGFKAIRPAGGKAELVAVGHSVPRDPAQAGGAGGSIADTASSAPLPILVLGGLALALAGAGAIGAGVRHARRRR